MDIWEGQISKFITLSCRKHKQVNQVYKNNAPIAKIDNMAV